MTAELADYLGSREAARFRLDPELFAASAEDDFRALLAREFGKVSSALAGAEIPDQLARFPVLSDYVETLASQWQAMTGELASRLLADMPELARRFTNGEGPGRVVAVDGGMGDRHRHGRQVLVLRFETGWRIVYKPRDIGPDEAFGKLLDWLSQPGALPAFRTPVVLCRTGYGWCEFVEPRVPATASESAALWHRAGGLLALLDLLNGRDCHWENVIVAGDQPVLIDAEGLFHRPLLGKATESSQTDSATPLSVLATGLTPYWKWDGGEQTESSGMGRADPQRIGQVLDGFAAAYRVLLARRSELLDPAGPLSIFAAVSVRTIFRDTARYQELMAGACTRDALASHDNRDAALAKLAHDQRDPRLAEVEAAELAALRRLDVPRFTARVGGRFVDLDGRFLPDWYESSGLDVVRQKVRLISEAELTRKLDYVRAAYALAALEASF